MGQSYNSGTGLSRNDCALESSISYKYILSPTRLGTTFITAHVLNFISISERLGSNYCCTVECVSVS